MKDTPFSPARNRVDDADTVALMPRILLVDDHTVIRRAIAGLLRHEGFPIVGEVTNGREAVEKARELRPDVILMDIRMPVMSGLAATRLICQEVPKARILILTVSEEDEDLLEAIRAGARGYLLKNADEHELFHAIHSVNRGDVVLASSVAGKVFADLTGPAGPGRRPTGTSGSTLTSREEEVLRLIARGHNNREIAQQLSISENTVKTHLRNILDKLHLQNRTQAALYAKDQLTQKD